MKPLISLPFVQLGSAAKEAPRVTAGVTVDGKQWRVTWLKSSGECRQATAHFGGGEWSESVPIPAGAPVSAPPMTRTGGILCRAGYGSSAVALRTGRRVIGERPVFPGAGLVVSCQVGAEWTDVGFADETPDGE